MVLEIGLNFDFFPLLDLDLEVTKIDFLALLDLLDMLDFIEL